MLTAQIGPFFRRGRAKGSAFGQVRAVDKNAAFFFRRVQKHLLQGMLGLAETIIGVDGSPRMIELAKRLLSVDASRVSLRIGDLEHLPLRDAEADFVAVNMVLHHLPEPFGSLDEIRRVLAPNGRLLITDFARHDCEEMRREYGDRWLGLDCAQLRDKLVELGFSILEDSDFAVEKGLTLKLIVAQHI